MARALRYGVSFLTAATFYCVTPSFAEEGTASPDPTTESAVWVRIALPKQLITWLDEGLPHQISWGLEGRSIGDNGERNEIPDAEIFSDEGPRCEHVSNTHYNWFGRRHKPDGGDGPFGAQYYVSRSPLTLTPLDDGQRFKVSTDLSFKLGLAIPQAIWAFPTAGFGDEWPRRATIAMELAVVPTADYGLKTTAIPLPPTVGPVVARFFIFSQDVSGMLKNYLESQLSPVGHDIAVAINGVSLRPAAEAAWKDLHKPFPINDRLKLFLEPRSAAASPLCLEGGELVVYLCIAGRARISDGGASHDASELPPLALVKQRDRRTSVETIAELSHMTIQSLVLELLRDKLLEVQGMTVVFGNGFALDAMPTVRDKAVGVELRLKHASVRSGTLEVPFDARIFSRPSIRVDGDKFVLALANELLDIKLPEGSPLSALPMATVKKAIQDQLPQFEVDISSEIARVLPIESNSDVAKLSIDDVQLVSADDFTVIENKTLKCRLAVSGNAHLTLGDAALAALQLPDWRGRDCGAEIGGGGGAAFRTQAPLSMDISALEIAYHPEDPIHLIGVVYSGLSVSRYGGWHLIKQVPGPFPNRPTNIHWGRMRQVTLQPGEYLVSVGLKNTNGLVGAAFFNTSKGRRFGPFGKAADDGTAWQELSAPLGFEICGFRGGAGDFLDRLGIIIRERR